MLAKVADPKEPKVNVRFPELARATSHSQRKSGFPRSLQIAATVGIGHYGLEAVVRRSLDGRRLWAASTYFRDAGQGPEGPLISHWPLQSQISGENSCFAEPANAISYPQRMAAIPTLCTKYLLNINKLLRIIGSGGRDQTYDQLIISQIA